MSAKFNVRRVSLLSESRETYQVVTARGRWLGTFSISRSASQKAYETALANVVAGRKARNVILPE